VVQAVQEQLDRYTHVCFPVSTYEPYVELAERLNQLTPGTHEKRTFFVNSGAEAVENAVKVARAFTGRPAVVCFEHGFHGRTNLAMALTSKVTPYKKGFGPFAPEVYRIPYPYCYRCSAGPSAGRCCMADRAWFERLFAATVDPDSVAAIVLELELGEGGFVPAPVEYVEALAAFAREHGILVVADEIQTGFGRTGRLFASEHYGLVPDIMTTAKSLAGGLPLAAVTGRADVMEAAQVGGLGGTYGGNPLACAAAIAVLDAMEGERLPERARRVGDRIRARFCQWAAAWPCVGDVRGLGAMIGMELVTDRATGVPDKALTGRLLAAALERGVVLLSAGTYGNVVRVLAPLTIEDAVLEEGLDAVEAALESVVGARAGDSRQVRQSAVR
ncbi:MAG TPA: aspartate aminotransferase family protein, partial [Methylomirabilota bacterium]|nr:aspartate aminotransferase family protein [Methylomirabilota bacterium]